MEDKNYSITFDEENGKLSLKGRFMEENLMSVMEPYVYKMYSHLQTTNNKTVLELTVEYFNTSCSKIFMDLFRISERFHALGKEVEVVWISEEDDDEIIHAGEDFAGVINVPFKLITIPPTY